MLRLLPLRSPLPLHKRIFPIPRKNFLNKSQKITGTVFTSFLLGSHLKRSHFSTEKQQQLNVTRKKPSSDSPEIIKRIFEEGKKELSTIKDFVRLAVSLFERAELGFGQGTKDSYADALFLIFGSLKLPVASNISDYSHLFLNSSVTSSEKEVIFSNLHKRIFSRIPSSYILQTAMLGSYNFYVDDRVIVPRSYIAEFLEEEGVEILLEFFGDKTPDQILSVLDLCTGAGSLAIQAANIFPSSLIDAVDISQAALDVARINVSLYDLEDRIKLIRSDLYAHVDPENRYDLILCNPPYVTKARMEKLADEFKKEPTVALSGGSDGLGVIRRVLKNSKNFLRKDGILVMEVCGHDLADLTRDFHRDSGIKIDWLGTSSGTKDVVVVRFHMIFAHFLLFPP